MNKIIAKNYKRASSSHLITPLRTLVLCLLVALIAACAPQTPQVSSAQVATLLAEMPAAITPETPSPVLPASPTVSPPEAPTITLAPTASSTFTPQPSASPAPDFTVTFAVIGDYGLSGTNAQDVATLVKSWNPDFVITTGDNNYPTGSSSTIDENIGQYYHEFISPYLGSYGEGADQNRFFPTLGNHDWDTSGAQPYLDYFTLPGNERYYDVTWGPLHFFALNSDPRDPDGVSSTSIQAQWLQDQMEASDAVWKIVYLHASPYSSGHHGSTPWMRWPYKEWGADAVLGGHDHTYERLLVDGITYFVNGVGGGAIYKFRDPIEGSQVRFNADYGAMLVTADDQQINFQFITRRGEVIDTYSLQASE